MLPRSARRLGVGFRFGQQLGHEFRPTDRFAAFLAHADLQAQPLRACQLACFLDDGMRRRGVELFEIASEGLDGFALEALCGFAHGLEHIMSRLPGEPLADPDRTCYVSKYPALTAFPIRLQMMRPAVMAVMPFTSRLGVISTMSMPTTRPLAVRPWMSLRIW